MDLTSWFEGLPTGGKVAVGVGALGLVYFVYKYKSSGSGVNGILQTSTDPGVPSGDPLGGGGFGSSTDSQTGSNSDTSYLGSGIGGGNGSNGSIPGNTGGVPNTVGGGKPSRGSTSSNSSTPAPTLNKTTGTPNAVASVTKTAEPTKPVQLVAKTSGVTPAPVASQSTPKSVVDLAPTQQQTFVVGSKSAPHTVTMTSGDNGSAPAGTYKGTGSQAGVMAGLRVYQVKTGSGYVNNVYDNSGKLVASYDHTTTPTKTPGPVASQSTPRSVVQAGKTKTVVTGARSAPHTVTMFG